MEIAHKTTIFLLGFLGVAVILATGTFLSVNEQNRQVEYTQNMVDVHATFMAIHHNHTHSPDAWDSEKVEDLEDRVEDLETATATEDLSGVHRDSMEQIAGKVKTLRSATDGIRASIDTGTTTATVENHIEDISQAAMDGESQSMRLLQSMETSGRSRVRSTYLMTGTLLIVLLINVALGHQLFRRRISSPIEELTEVINDISRGETDVKIDTELKERDDEIGRLARSFERTLASLKLAMERSAPVLEEKNKSLQDVIAEKEEIEKNLEELVSTLDTTLDTIEEGVLIVSPDGTILHSNERFQEMWNIPEELMETGEDEELIEHVTEQLKDPEGFKKRVQELYNNPKDGKSDMIHFKDGRRFKRVFKTLTNEKTNIGWAWIFRDVTGMEGQDDA